MSKLHRTRHVLLVVMAINLVLFLVEGTIGWFARSSALLADAFDMLVDSLAIAVSVVALLQGRAARLRSALFKGVLQIAFGAAIFAQSAIAAGHGHVPNGLAIEVAALLALAGNVGCAVLLSRYRRGDVDLRALWLCSRNDIVANLSIFLAGALVLVLDSRIPDLVVAWALGCLFLATGLGVVREVFWEKTQVSTSGRNGLCRHSRRVPIARRGGTTKRSWTDDKKSVTTLPLAHSTAMRQPRRV